MLLIADTVRSFSKYVRCILKVVPRSAGLYFTTIPLIRFATSIPNMHLMSHDECIHGLDQILLESLPNKLVCALELHQKYPHDCHL